MKFFLKPKLALLLLAVKRLGMAWRHLPIPDRQPPGLDFERRWAEVGAELVVALREGRRIFLHCKGGLGRTGTVAACLLREAGVGAAEAVTQVRLARPKTIETTEQERYVQVYRRRFGASHYTHLPPLYPIVLSDEHRERADELGEAGV